MRKPALFLFFGLAITLLAAQEIRIQFRHVDLPTSKTLAGLMPGRVAPLNGFTPTIAVSPDKHYAALLNDGYGSQQNKVHQSIAILDLNTNKLTDFPDDRLAEDAHQSYFIGLGFSSDGSSIWTLRWVPSPIPRANVPATPATGLRSTNFRTAKSKPNAF